MPILPPGGSDAIFRKNGTLGRTREPRGCARHFGSLRASRLRRERAGPASPDGGIVATADDGVYFFSCLPSQRSVIGLGQVSLRARVFPSEG